MKDFFNVTPLETVFGYIKQFPRTGVESIDILAATGRIVAEDITAPEDVPGFARATMDGYAVAATSTFGASESNPAYLPLDSTIAMGEKPAQKLPSGTAIRISTGGMLPAGADSVVMVEYAAEIDDTTLEVYKSAAPGGNVIIRGEDVHKDQPVLLRGTKLRPQEVGLLAALGIRRVGVFKKPVIGIISTGDEIVTIDKVPGPGTVRDVNSYTLSSQVVEAGGFPVTFGIVKDQFAALAALCKDALKKTDMLILSGGSSVGMRDLTIDVLHSLDNGEILVHGIPISPGKPTILACAGETPVWGLPGHVSSAMVVFDRVVRPFITYASGASPDFTDAARRINAKITRNIASAQGRTDFVRVRLKPSANGLLAEPVLGKSGLIHPMVQAHGLVEIDMNTEGLDQDTPVSVILL